MPVLHPAEIWQESGRWDEIGDEMFRLKDRKGADMALAMTHEEVITWLAAREVHSYKQLPQLWYHIQTKERDEARPKSGILRTREFIMKDSYSLDRDMDGLQASYQRHIDAYDRIMRALRPAQRMMVLSDPGMMGGAISHEYMAPSEAGEDVVVFCRCVRLRGQRRAGGGREEAAAGESGAAQAPTAPDRRAVRRSRPPARSTPRTCARSTQVEAFLGSAGARLHEVAGRDDRGTAPAPEAPRRGRPTPSWSSCAATTSSASPSCASSSASSAWRPPKRCWRHRAPRPASSGPFRRRCR